MAAAYKGRRVYPGKCSVPAPPPTYAAARLKKEYPFDSHQDDIIVNSTELDTPGRKIGLDHYRHQLTLRKTYKHISTDFAKDHARDFPKDAPTPLSPSPLTSDDEDEDEYEDENDENNNANASGKNAKPTKRTRWQQDTSTIIIATTIATTLPKPLTNRINYLESIYTITTSNPAVLLSILRIAERNLPFINFDSAIMHLPNVAANARVPALPCGSHRKENGQPAFVDDIPWQEPGEVEMDEVMTILFLPRFYTDGRHAVGYYALAPHYTPSPAQPLAVSDVVQILFTPCHTADLVQAGLVEWVPGDDGREGADSDDLGVEYIQCVGARRGDWLDRDVVEDWEEWCVAFRAVRRVWEKVLKEVVAREEGGGCED
jgi:hypothetical protein